ncbi:MAG: SDR family oxidoreductase [Rhodocyclaceae bacterium]|nr:SDR family oxidoreductase [Rhodocyclaceae bacterium]
MAGLRVFITGASSGIGAALAAHYAHGGATLGLLARRLDKLEAVAAGLPGRHFLYVADVTDAPAVIAAAEDFMQGGVPDIVIANAGISVGTLTEHAEDFPAFAKVFQTNVLGLFATFQPFIGPMSRQGRGTLAGIASVAGIRGLPGAGAYSASKAAAISYLESLRVELRSRGIRVTTVCPGYIETPMTAVNDYAMPFILPAGEAARRIARVIAKGRSYAVLPWQMAIVAKLMRLLPNSVYDRLFANKGRKPRGLDL